MASRRPIEADIPCGKLRLPGSLVLPEKPLGVVAFAHGSGSSRASPRNVHVAEVLQRASIATLLFDLLTAREDRNYDNRFNVALLAERLVGATAWLRGRPDVGKLPLGYFGASTGAAAALRAAALRGKDVSAIVSRGGRPDLAGVQPLEQVVSPTLLIVGGNDEVVQELNRRALEHLQCEKQLLIVPGASHLFEEPGALDEVARHAAEWFVRWFAPSTA